jgi:hypothetical protein
LTFSGFVFAAIVFGNLVVFSGIIGSYVPVEAPSWLQLSSSMGGAAILLFAPWVTYAGTAQTLLLLVALNKMALTVIKS